MVKLFRTFLCAQLRVIFLYPEASVLGGSPRIEIHALCCCAVLTRLRFLLALKYNVSRVVLGLRGRQAASR